MKVGINGMGRIGRLALRAALGAAERPADDPRAGHRLEVVHLNELKGGAAATAHLLAFDSVQGKWRADIAAESDSQIRIDPNNCIIYLIIVVRQPVAKRYDLGNVL